MVDNVGSTWRVEKVVNVATGSIAEIREAKARASNVVKFSIPRRFELLRIIRHPPVKKVERVVPRNAYVKILKLRLKKWLKL